MKTTYLDIIEKSLGAYPNLSEMAELEQADDLQVFSRITSALAVMVDNGRMPDFKNNAVKMFDICLDSIVKMDGKTDFSIKEIMLAFKLLKKTAKPQKAEEWKNKLSAINPYEYYFNTLQNVPRDALHNINMYNMAGEYLRESEGLCDCEEYFDKHMPVQIERFDENGMYHDPGSPMLYDIATRVQIQLILGFGYKGKYADRLDNLLRLGGLATLYTQSAKFEFPYGGRSNQFLFNEALICSVGEYEAARYKRLGDLKTAGMFKRMAHLAIESIEPWLCATPPRHIKNFYPTDSRLGAEKYGFYDKYMISLGNFIYPAFIFAQEDIKEVACPAETGGYIYELPKFHKIFANCGKHSIEIDTSADFHYDATGLGRIHHQQAPSELGLSMPFTKTPNYKIEGQSCNLSICAGWDEDGKVKYLSEMTAETTSEIEKQEASETVFTVNYKLNSPFCEGIKEKYCLTERSVKITAELINPKISKIYYTVPIFADNGRDLAEVKFYDNKAETTLKNHKFTATTDGKMSKASKFCYNRNGKYNVALIEKADKSINLEVIFEQLSDSKT